MPAVSVIIPNYNHANFLAQRLNSILNQTYQDFEIIILDDCSTDNSKQVIENYRKNGKISQIIYNTENSGSTFKQWDKGIELAKGEYVWIAESDDYCENNFLEELINQHLTNPNIGISYCRSYPVDRENNITDYNDEWQKRVHKKRWDSDYFNIGRNECEKYLSIQCTIPNASAILFKKEALQTVDILSEHYKVCGDWKTYMSILSKFNIAYTLKTTNYHRGHENNARSIYGYRVIHEQIEIMSWTKENFNVERSSLYRKSLEEKINTIVILFRTKKISFSNATSMILKMHKLDYFILLRTVKVGIFNIFKIKIGLG